MDLIVDANSLYARSWYAAKNIDPDSTQALRLAATTLLNLLNPNYNRIGSLFKRSLFCWDIQQDAAKNREPKPAEYHAMRAVAKEMFELLLGTLNFELAPYEGDDLVASAVCAAKPGTDVYVVSGDKDLMQLVDHNIHYFSLNEKCVLTPTFICEKFHVKHPSQIALALAIQGDQVDCVSGVRGWGPARVKKLFHDVPKGVKFEEALRILAEHMNEEQQEQFIESLQRTLPAMDVPVPEPVPIIFPDEDEVDALGIPEISYRFREVKFIYEHEPF